MDDFSSNDFGLENDDFSLMSFEDIPEDRMVYSERGEVYYYITRCPKENSPWLVLTHAIGMDHNSWDDVIDSLSGICNILTWDMPFHGQSEIYGSFTFENAAKDLKDILEKESIEKAFISGACIGGCIAQVFANLYPEACSGLILIDTFPFGKELYNNADLAWLKKFGAPFRALPSFMVSTTMAGLFTATPIGERKTRDNMKYQSTPRVIDALLYSMAEFPTRDSVVYPFPVMAIIGEYDRLGPIKVVNEKACDNYGYIYIPIRGAGHLSFIDNTQDVCGIMSRLIQSESEEK